MGTLLLVTFSNTLPSTWKRHQVDSTEEKERVQDSKHSHQTPSTSGSTAPDTYAIVSRRNRSRCRSRGRQATAACRRRIRCPTAGLLQHKPQNIPQATHTIEGFLTSRKIPERSRCLFHHVDLPSSGPAGVRGWHHPVGWPSAGG